MRWCRWCGINEDVARPADHDHDFITGVTPAIPGPGKVPVDVDIFKRDPERLPEAFICFMYDCPTTGEHVITQVTSGQIHVTTEFYDEFDCNIEVGFMVPCPQCNDTHYHKVR